MKIASQIVNLFYIIDIQHFTSVAVAFLCNKSIPFCIGAKIIDLLQKLPYFLQKDDNTGSTRV